MLHQKRPIIISGMQTHLKSYLRIKRIQTGSFGQTDSFTHTGNFASAAGNFGPAGNFA